MKVTSDVCKYHVEISFDDIFKGLKRDDILQLVEYAACQDDLIKYVADQIVLGWTSGAYCGHGPESGPSRLDGTALSSARKRVAKGSGELANAMIDSLEAALVRCEAQYLDSCTEVSKLMIERDELAHELRQLKVVCDDCNP